MTTTAGHERTTLDDRSILKTYIDRYSNWGRWGTDDEIGTLNFVGPEQVRAAATLVRQGKTVSLSLPYDLNLPQDGKFRINPLLVMSATGTDHVAGRQDPLPGAFGPAHGIGFADDYMIMPNQAGTQWDALSHVFYEGKMYNGRDAGEVDSHGALHNGIQNYTARITMRGVLLDVAGHRGVTTLEPGDAIGGDELDAVAAAQGVEIRSGDAVLVRTGFLGARRSSWGDYAGGAAPGLSLHSVPWLAEHEIAAVATDTWGAEVRPNEIDQFQPLHIVALTYMGLAIGEIFELDALADDCASDGVYEFFFVASPLPLTGAVGSPVSALAIK
jgi:kynurenine formamidase